MSTAVLIPCHSRTDLLKISLAALGEATVLVVDDSAHGLGEMPCPAVRTSGELGFARAVNIGLRHLSEAGHRLVLLLNDDAVVQPGALRALLAAWTEADGAIAPVLQAPDSSLSSGFVVRKSGRVRVRSGGVSEPTQVDAVSGAAMLIRATERLDEGYVHGFEDLDLCRRLRARGLGIRTLPVRCSHIGGASVSRTSQQAQRAAISGHLRYLGGGWRSGFAVGLSLAQVIREGCSPARFVGILQGCKDHRQRAQSVGLSADLSAD